MRRAAALIVLAAAACGDRRPVAEALVPLRIVTAAADVDLGKSFALTVVRTWRKDAPPEEWKDEVLAPLAVRAVETVRSESDGRVEEVRQFRAYAFAAGDVTLAADPSIRLRVRPSLDPAAPGTPELPGGPLPEPFPWTVASVGVAAVLAASAALVARTRRRRPPTAASPAASPPRPPAHAEALRRLDELRARNPHGSEEIAEFHAAAAAIVREYLAERFAVTLTTRTSEELGAALPLTDAHRERLASILARCDLVKFAREAPDAAACERLVESARTLVTETAA